MHEAKPHGRLGRYDEALQSFDKALEIEPKNEEIKEMRDCTFQNIIKRLLREIRQR